jgi:hypothetical protein
MKLTIKLITHNGNLIGIYNNLINNMKLYTEEQIRDALDNEDFAYIADIVIAQMQPIEITIDKILENK